MLQKSESSSSHSSDKPLTHFGNPDSHQLSPERPPIQLTSKSKMSRRKKRPTTRLVVNIADTHYPIVKKVAKGIMGFKVSRDSQTSEWDLLWTDNAVQIQQLAKMEPHQKINHFPGMFTLSRKNYLARNLDKMAKKFPEEYGFYPQTWILPSELNQLRRHFDEEPNSIVIAKPQASCQGRGIFLSKSIDDFQFGEHYVVQRYLKKPFLIDKLKFDLRIYVLVAGCDPLRLYIYRQGLARFATQSYKTPRKDNLNNMFMHLTNYAINKVNKKFEFNADSTQMNYGHKRSVTSIMQTLQSLGHNTAELWSQICDIIIKTIISVQPILSHHYRSCQPLNYANNMCFEILGFDVILDHNLKPSILQVNYTPSFTTDTPLDTLIKQNLIHDTLSLLNLSNKTKIDTVKARKQQLIERTLTGKQVWLDPIARAQIVAREQTKRDVWQSSHLGNFHKLYSLPDDPKQQCYNEFLKYSEQCYQQLTGGNIKRNQKVITASHSENESQKIMAISKLNKAEQLERIYINKMRKIPCIRKMTKSKLAFKEEQSREQKHQSPGTAHIPCEMIRKHQQMRASRAMKEEQEKTDKDLPERAETKTPGTIADQRSKKEKFYQTWNQTKSKILIVNDQQTSHEPPHSPLISQIQTDPKKRAASAKNRQAISKIYNITFKQVSKYK